MQLAEAEPATVGLSAQTLARLTKWPGVWIFSTPERWLNSPTRFREMVNISRLNRV